MSKIIEGLWDCPYCEQKGISGLKKHCPCCGHPQDDGTKFYMGQEIVYVDPEKAAQYGQGADWTCSYCGSLNRHEAVSCANCGADREENKGDYFDNEKARKAEAARIAAEEKAKRDAERMAEIRAAKARRRPYVMAALIALAALLAFMLIPRNKGAELIRKDWARTIFVQEEQTVEESDWTIPDGGRQISESREIHHYDQVLDHYEDVEVEKSRRVQDGYDEETTYTDNGDGTFTEETIQVPHYETEYYTEIEQQPVYVEVPNFQTKYTYEIERWIDTRQVDTAGGDDEPYWGDAKLTAKEREGYREETYKLTFQVKKKTYEALVDEVLFTSLKKGDNVNITIKNGKVIEVNGSKVLTK